MIDYTKYYAGTRAKSYDEGLRTYMLNIYNYVALALVVTGIAAAMTLYVEPIRNLMFAISPYGQFIGNTGFGTLITFAPVLIALYFFFGFNKLNIDSAKILLWVYAALTGMSLASLGLIYTGDSIASTFFICAATFGAMSLYGYTTRRDLTSLGSFMVMGLIGVVITSLINMFLHSAAIYFVTSLIAIVIFMGLIAWDTQKLKSIYYTYGSFATGSAISVLGAFTLYLDFINLFLYLLRFVGNRRE